MKGRMEKATIAIVTKARGTFFKPLYEAFAGAQPKEWGTLLMWPEELRNEHPEALVVPVAENLEIRGVASGRKADAGGGEFTAQKRFLPSRQAWRELASRPVRGVLIHEFSPFTLQALWFAKCHGAAVAVSTEVGRGNAHFFPLMTRWWHAFWGQMVDGVVACCPAARRPLSGRKVPVVEAYHAVDSRVYLPLSRGEEREGPLVFAFLGQLIPRKGLDLWLAAAARMLAAGRAGFELRFIGAGDEAWLRGEVARLGLGDKVRFAGFLSGAAIREALGSADVFVLPTREDTYAAVVHEAACLGLPLLVSRHAGAAEALVREGVNGHVFDPEDVEGFAAVMEGMFDAGKRRAFGREARAVGEAFSAHERGRAVWAWMEREVLGQG